MLWVIVRLCLVFYAAGESFMVVCKLMYIVLCLGRNFLDTCKLMRCASFGHFELI
jgi:hypothetical protein